MQATICSLLLEYCCCCCFQEKAQEMAVDQTAAPGAEKKKKGWCWIRRGAGSEVAWISIAWTMRRSSSAWEQRGRRRSWGWERLCGGEAGAGARRRQTTTRSRAEEKLGQGGGGAGAGRRQTTAVEDLKSWAEEDDDGDLKIGATMLFPAFSPGRKVFPSDLYYGTEGVSLSMV